MSSNNLILIEGGTEGKVKKALKQWIDVYIDSLENGLTFEFYKNGLEKYVIKADDRLSNDSFFYLINYLKYPEDIDYDIEIEGYTIGKNKDILKNRKLLVYISADDREYDNVFVTTNERSNYKIDFGGKITEVYEIKDFKRPPELKLNRPEIFEVNNSEFLEKLEATLEAKVDKRFKKNLRTLLGLISISLVSAYFFRDSFYWSALFLGYGITIWFFLDYKILQPKKHYIYCLLISIAFLEYFFLVSFLLPKFQFNFPRAILSPLSLLIIQKPARLIFKYCLKREPVVELKTATSWDLLYILILILAFIVLVFIGLPLIYF